MHSHVWQFMLSSICNKNVDDTIVQIGPISTINFTKLAEINLNNLHIFAARVWGIGECITFKWKEGSVERRGLDKAAEDRLARFLFILCSETIQQKMGRNA